MSTLILARSPLLDDLHPLWSTPLFLLFCQEIPIITIFIHVVIFLCLSKWTSTHLYHFKVLIILLLPLCYFEYLFYHFITVNILPYSMLGFCSLGTAVLQLFLLGSVFLIRQSWKVRHLDILMLPWPAGLSRDLESICMG